MCPTRYSHRQISYLIQFQWCARRPAHALVNNRYEIADFAGSGHVDLSNAVQRLLRCVEVLQENHD